MKKLKWYLLSSLIPLFFPIFIIIIIMGAVGGGSTGGSSQSLMGQPTQTTGQMVTPIPIIYSFIAMVLKQSNWTVF